jgi:hypothetical protein
MPLAGADYDILRGRGVILSRKAMGRAFSEPGKYLNLQRSSVRINWL